MAEREQKEGGRVITPQDERRAERLRALWNKRKDELGWTQEKLAEHWGVKQSTISQYLNAKIALNTDAVLRFAKDLQTSPLLIAPELLKDLISDGNPMAWIKVNQIEPDTEMEYYALGGDRRQRVARWTAKDGFVSAETGKPLKEVIAVVPSLPPE